MKSSSLVWWGRHHGLRVNFQQFSSFSASVSLGLTNRQNRQTFMLGKIHWSCPSWVLTLISNIDPTVSCCIESESAVPLVGSILAPSCIKWWCCPEGPSVWGFLTCPQAWQQSGGQLKKLSDIRLQITVVYIKLKPKSYSQPVWIHHGYSWEWRRFCIRHWRRFCNRHCRSLSSFWTIGQLVNNGPSFIRVLL